MTFPLYSPPQAVMVLSPLQLRQAPWTTRTGADWGQVQSCRLRETQGLGFRGHGLGYRRTGKNDYPLRSHGYPRDCAPACIPGTSCTPVAFKSGVLTELSFPAGSWPGRRPPPSIRAPSCCKTAPPSKKLRGRQRLQLRLRARAASGEGHLGPDPRRPAQPSRVREPVNSQLCHLPSVGHYEN